MGNVIPTCMTIKHENGTMISVRSRCFEKPIKIMISEEDDDALDVLNNVLTLIRDKKIARSAGSKVERKITEYLEKRSNPRSLPKPELLEAV